MTFLPRSLGEKLISRHSERHPAACAVRPERKIGWKWRRQFAKPPPDPLAASSGCLRPPKRAHSCECTKGCASSLLRLQTWRAHHQGRSQHGHCRAGTHLVCELLHMRVAHRHSARNNIAHAGEAKRFTLFFFCVLSPASFPLPSAAVPVRPSNDIRIMPSLRIPRPHACTRPPRAEITYVHSGNSVNTG